MSFTDSVRKNLSALKHPGSLQNENVQEQIIQYLMLIAKWNKHYNLTAIKTVDDMLFQHAMDSLVVIQYLNGPHIVDVGTGAGLPGIPIAIAQPDWHVTLIESNQKKAAFLQQVKIELALNNIEIVANRVENIVIQKSINTIISRAYTSLGNFIKTTQHLAGSKADQCQWVAMKGSCSQDELNEVINPYVVKKRIPLTVPGLLAKRELIIIEKKIMAKEPALHQEYQA